MNNHRTAVRKASPAAVLGTAIAADRASAGLARPRLEAATIRDKGADGTPVSRAVSRRAVAPCIKRLPESRQLAAAAYASAYEVVSAGGQSPAFAAEKVEGGTGCAEGPQARAVGAAGALARMNAALGAHVRRA